MDSPLFFEPIYQERVWGGVQLRSAFGRKLPENKRIGESWEVVDRPEAQSVIARGPAAGRTLRALLAEFPKEIMGPVFSAAQPFPVLVKWLDCRERLSLQVHPPAEIAKELGGEPKTENWFIARAENEAGLIVGLKSGTTRERFETAIEAQTLEEHVHRFPVEAGHSILVRSGQIHAIDGGNLILEIQQNSDTTYRVYDWGRVGLDGKPRTLHVEESLASIDFSDVEPAPMPPTNGDALLAACEEFTIRKFQLTPGRRVELSGGKTARLLHVVSGSVTIASERGSWEAAAGENLLLPFAGDFAVTAAEGAVVLATSDFA